MEDRDDKAAALAKRCHLFSLSVLLAWGLIRLSTSSKSNQIFARSIDEPIQFFVATFVPLFDGQGQEGSRTSAFAIFYSSHAKTTKEKSRISLKGYECKATKTTNSDVCASFALTSSDPSPDFFLRFFFRRAMHMQASDTGPG